MTTNEIIKEKEDKKTTPKTTPDDNPKPPSRELVDIGRGHFNRQEVDPYSRLTNYIWSRMHVVDIIPCDFEIPLVRSPESVTNDLIKALTPTISYDARMIDYEEQCVIHGLSRRSGVRLWITDETQIDEQFDQSYEDSIFQNAIDGFQKFLKTFRQIGRSSSSRYGSTQLGVQKFVSKFIEKGEEALGKGVIASYGLLNPKAEDDPNFKANVTKILDNVGELSKVLADVTLKGNRITMPKIWQNSTYGQNFSCHIKLASPYGTPAAITKYIVRPLIYLLMLGTPRTDNDVSYGNSHPLSIRAYGLGWYKLGAIKTISVRRGGANSMYNANRQPLTVDVTVTFQNLIDGFAVFGKDHDKADLLARASTDLSTQITGDASSQALMTNIETFVDSFRPIGSNIGGGLNAWEDYRTGMGGFTKGNTPQYPEAYNVNLVTDNPNDLSKPSIVEKALNFISEIDPTVALPENATADDILNFIEATADATGGVYNDIKTELLRLRAGTTSSQDQSESDFVRATATETSDTLSDNIASDDDDNTLNSLTNKLPTSSDFTPRRLA